MTTRSSSAIMATADHPKLPRASTSSIAPNTSHKLPFGESSVPSESRTPMANLPNEILIDIFRFLDGPPPSANQQLWYDEPTFDLLSSPHTDLKNVSLVSNRWRQAVLPILYRHAQFKIPEREREDGVVGLEFQYFLDFLTRHRLGEAVTSFTVCCYAATVVESCDEKSLEVLKRLWKSVFDVFDPIEVFVIAPAEGLGFLTACPVFTEEAWCFDTPCHYLRLERPRVMKLSGAQSTDAIKAESMSIDARSATSMSPTPSGSDSSDTLPYPAEVINSPRLALLSESGSGSPGGAAAELMQAEAVLRQQYADGPVLFGVPWTKLLLNEGSFIRAYATYEFWERRPPSILKHLLGTRSTRALISSTIRHLSYIAIFPMEPHFRYLTETFPRIDSIYIQIVPRNEILHSPARMTQVESTDLWLERNRCYAILMRELFNAPPLGNFRFLQSFESGDAADQAAWEMAVEYVKRAGNGWKAVSEGVFVKEERGDDLPEEELDATAHSEGSAFGGALVRWAWNGTTVLPVSARPLYDRPLGPVT